MIVGWQSDLINTKQSKLLVYDKSDHKNKSEVHKGEETEVLRPEWPSGCGQWFLLRVLDKWPIVRYSVGF